MREFKKGDKLLFNRITNDNLICKNCKNMMDDAKIFANTLRCEAYDTKPTAVIKGGTSCPKFLRGE